MLSVFIKIHIHVNQHSGFVGLPHYICHQAEGIKYLPAKTMELIFPNLIIYRYNQKQAENVVRQCDEWLNDVKPDYQKYIHPKKEAKSKKCLLHDFKVEQKHTPKLNITKQMSLSKEITALTEDIEELKSELSNLFLSYRDEASFLELCSKIPSFEERRKKQADLQATLESRIAEQTKSFLALKNNVLPDQETELKSERSLIHPDTIEHAREHLQSAYQSKFDYQHLQRPNTISLNHLMRLRKTFLSSSDWNRQNNIPSITILRIL